MPSPNRLKEAFKESANLVGLATAAALSAATLNPLPLLVGLVAEAAYLLFVPDTRWYESRLERRFDAEVERRRQQLKDEVLPQVSREMQSRFERLEEARRQIGAQPMGDARWFREVLRKLDFLLEKFLHFASKEVQFRSYLSSVLEEARGGRGKPARAARGDAEDLLRNIWVLEDRRPPRSRGGEKERGRRRPEPPDEPEKPDERLPADPYDRWVRQTTAELQGIYERELAELRRLRQEEQDVTTQAVLEKRVEVLERRNDFVAKMGRILMNLNHQVQLLEDTFGLISDEIRARPPEQVLADIEDVVWQTNSMTQLLEEMAPFERMVARLSEVEASTRP